MGEPQALLVLGITTVEARILCFIGRQQVAVLLQVLLELVAHLRVGEAMTGKELDQEGFADFLRCRGLLGPLL